MTSLTLELGARRIWGNYTEGKWVEVGKDRNNHRLFKHQPAKYDITVSDDIAKGLQQESEDWQEANASGQRPAGELNRMIRVSNVKKSNVSDATNEPPLMRGLNRVVDRLVASLENLKK